MTYNISNCKMLERKTIGNCIGNMTAIPDSAKYHHGALVQGYVSRRQPEGYAFDYDGQFGKGYILFMPNYHTTRFCNVEYFIEED